VLIEGMDVVCNEGIYHDQDVVNVEKQSLDDAEHPNCFILSESLITRGTGKAVVCAIGELSRRGL
jgi:hypothetical protein